MLNNRKVRLMTQLAIYEKRQGKEDIKLSKYFKSDYARLNVLKTAIMVTIAYVLVVALVLLYKFEYLLDNVLTLDYASMGKSILGFYIGVMAVYLIATMLGYSLSYTRSHKKLGKYFRMLRKLKDIYNEEDSYAAGNAAYYDEGEDSGQ